MSKVRVWPTAIRVPFGLPSPLMSAGFVILAAPDGPGILNPQRSGRAQDSQSSAFRTGSGLLVLGALKGSRIINPVFFLTKAQN